SAPNVVMSAAALDGERPLRPSPLIAAFPHEELSAPSASWASVIAETLVMERVADDRAPALPPQATAPGGSRIVASQSDCPFQAMARFRLGAEPWPGPLIGLSHQERGIAAHA